MCLSSQPCVVIQSVPFTEFCWQSEKFGGPSVFCAMGLVNFNPAVGGWSWGEGVKKFWRPAWGGLKKFYIFLEGDWKILHCWMIRGFFTFDVFKGSQNVYLYLFFWTKASPFNPIYFVANLQMISFSIFFMQRDQHELLKIVKRFVKDEVTRGGIKTTPFSKSSNNLFPYNSIFHISST